MNPYAVARRRPELEFPQLAVGPAAVLPVAAPGARPETAVHLAECLLVRFLASLFPARWAMAAVALVGMAALGCALPARAHEIGTVEVVVTFDADGQYQLEIPLDPLSTYQRLAIGAGRDISVEPTEEQAIQGIEELREGALSRIRILFDDQAVTPAIQYQRLPPLETGPLGRFVLQGQVPPGAREFQFAYKLVFTRYVLKVHAVSGQEPTLVWLEGAELSPKISIQLPKKPSVGEVFVTYLGLGFTHILPKGLDHILFVLGLFLLSTAWRPLLWQVSAFTLAHTLTLGLATYGVFSLSPSIVEPLIALSIVYVALENTWRQDLGRWRVALVFAFGLLHGLGFAGVLEELGLPKSQLFTALLSFNLGVELGQLAVLALAFLAVASWARHRPWYRQRVVLPGSLLIAAIGLYWTIERIWGG